VLIDRCDEAGVGGLRERKLWVTATDTLMRDGADRERLARAVLAAGAETARIFCGQELNGRDDAIG
jgi:hypothetical protein